MYAYYKDNAEKGSRWWSRRFGIRRAIFNECFLPKTEQRLVLEIKSGQRSTGHMDRMDIQGSSERIPFKETSSFHLVGCSAQVTNWISTTIQTYFEVMMASQLPHGHGHWSMGL
jgi:hypothetical protein